MANSYFQFKQFIVHQDKCAMKVTTDACLFGAWIASQLQDREDRQGNILDIGTGTGLLSLMIAQKTSMAIDAVELDPEAAKQAYENFTASPLKNQINLLTGDVRDLPVLLEKKYDVIVSNPPFYENELVSPDERRNIAHHGGGLLLKELLQIISDRLQPGGIFFIMLPFKRVRKSGWGLEQFRLEINSSLYVRQSDKHDFFRVFILGQQEGAKPPAIHRSELSVRDSVQQYTPEFIHLLKDYYLNF
jgi:tRNA1Val (adenine37-N6)-methyltransferase